MCRKSVAVFLIILFVPIFILTVIGWSLKSTVLNPNHLSKQLDKNNIYDQVLNSAPKILLQTLSQGKDQPQQLPLNEQDIANAVKESVTRDWLKINAQLVISEVLNYLNGKSNQIQATIDLKQIKSGLEKFQITLLKAQVSTLPECTSSTQTNNNNDLNCRPKNMSVDQLLVEINKNPESKQENLASGIPDTWNIGTILNPQNGPSTLTPIRQFISFFNIGWIAAAITSAVLFILIALLIFKPLPSLLRWLATTLLIPGILLLSSATANLIISAFIKGSTWNLPAGLSDLANKLVAAVLSGFANRITYISIGIILIAIIFYIIAVIIKPKIKEKNV
ncbi:MAG: hypothetical protein M1338_02920 [Patescibacteria group bacterium]|nr:hypothetical protein [Patescibacteria group bacterium]